ncbi:uncharacterized protein LOC143895397 [Temnothorax americanus]|uniref:uncharacterized protein LOC143895397 n=1 Tax=Temnothorax americanus TaxID=1964332 RepID=UPI004068FB79
MSSKVFVVFLMVSIVGLIVPKISSALTSFNRKCVPGKSYHTNCNICYCDEGTEKCTRDYCQVFDPNKGQMVKAQEISAPDDFWEQPVEQTTLPSLWDP